MSLTCDFPFYVWRKSLEGSSSISLSDRVPVPCGRCDGCIRRRVAMWSARLQIEERDSTEAYFVSLDFAHCPISPRRYMTLDKKPLQKYFKRIRKLGYNLRYYAVGEYGSQKMRPHYHVIMFNVPPEVIRSCWEDYQADDHLYVTGRVHIGKVEGPSINYTLKYITKKGRVPEHKNDDRLPEFSLMSKGLGDRYIRNEQIVKKHKEDITRTYLVRPGGAKVPLPRHWRDKLYTKEQRMVQALAIEKQVNAAEEKRQRLYIERTGSLDGYKHSQSELKFERLKAIQYSAGKRK